MKNLSTTVKRIILTFVLITLSTCNVDLISAEKEDISLIATVDKEEQLLKDFQAFWTEFPVELEDIIYEYYGTYDECDIVWVSGIDWLYTTDIKEISIGKYVFKFYSGSASETFYVYKNNTFIPVKNAYLSGLLSDEDIAVLAENFNEISIIGNASCIDVSLYYEDVTTDDWFYSCVNNVSEKKVMTGLDSDTFEPYATLARAQFATILYRMSASPDTSYQDIFPDVTEKEWYTNAVLWAAENEIVAGYENGMFGPADMITREQMAVMLYRYAEYKGYAISENTELDSFPDASDVSNFAKEAVGWCVANGIISGNNGNLKPLGNTSRAECAAMISRYIDLYE